MKTIFFFILSLFLFLETFSQSFQVGITSKTYTDVNRNNRQVKAEIYYPALSAGNNTTPANGKFPFIVFGHGFVMTYTAYENLSSEWIPKGYIIVFANTETGFSPNHEEFGKDLRFLVNAFLMDNSNNAFLLYNKIDSASAIMGHSMGGGSSFLASANNNSIKTVIGFAPAETNPSTITAAANVTVPALILSGEKDGVTPPAQHHLPIYNALASVCKTFVNIKGGAHCYFAKPNFNCDFGETTSSPGISITRQGQQQVTYDLVGLWLNYYLKNNTNSLSVFLDSLQQSNRITYQNFCVIPSATEVDFLQKTGFEIFPNPASTYLDITSDGYPYELKIVSADGQWFRLVKITEYAQRIDLSTFPDGLYFVSFHYGKTVLHKKLFIVRNSF